VYDARSDKQNIYSADAKQTINRNAESQSAQPKWSIIVSSQNKINFMLVWQQEWNFSRINSFLLLLLLFSVPKEHTFWCIDGFSARMTTPQRQEINGRNNTAYVYSTIAHFCYKPVERIHCTLFVHGNERSSICHEASGTNQWIDKCL
jgi:hypothetical protein